MADSFLSVRRIRVRIRSYQSLLHQIVQNQPGILLRRMPDRRERKLRLERGLVGIADAGEVLDLAPAGLRVDPLDVATLAFLQRRIHEHFDEAVGASHGAGFVPGCPVRTYRGADDQSTVPHDLGGLKVDGGKAELISEMAVVDPTAGGNPIPLTKEGSRKLFEAALSGNLAAAAA